MIDIKIDSKNDVFSGLDLARLKPKSRLYPKFWSNGKLNTIVARKLMKIADQIVKAMEIDVEIDDIIITGSIASFNWHELSDIDLHVLLDFTKIDENYDLVKKMLDQSRINWNKTHNILISNKEVELYFQDTNEEHKSGGMWTLTREKWLKEPQVTEVDIDLVNTEKKAENIVNSIKHISDLFLRADFKGAYDYASKIKNKVARMRSTGLSKEGIYSPENLAFKMLRNANWLQRLSALKVQSYDKMMSLKLEIKTKNDFNKSWKDYLK